MLRQVKPEDYNYLLNSINHMKLENVYLYIDVVTYGFCGDKIYTYVIVDDFQSVDAVIYEYYNSIQLLEINILKDDQISELADFLNKKMYKRISGSTSFINRLFFFTKESYEITNGLLMKYVDSPYKYEKKYVPFFASVDDFSEIAKLICNDPHLGKSYNEVDLKNQLIKRFTEDGCENMCIKENGRIVSHFATYAITQDLAVMSGMVTDPVYRGKGMGSVLVKDLSMHIVCQGKTPVLYCYEEEYNTWYEKLGYSVIGTNSKLELKINSEKEGKTWN